MNKKLEFNFGSNSQAETDKEETEKLEKMTAGLPDPGTAKLERFKKRPRVAMMFKVPDLIKEEWCNKAKELGFTRQISGVEVADQTAMLYHAMRAVGIDIPDDEFIDGRKR